MTKKNLKVLVSVFAYNEGSKFENTLNLFPAEHDYDVLVVDDGSTDGTAEHVRRHNFLLIQNGRNLGLGASIKKAFQYALDNQYDVIVIMAGNGKDNPNEIDRLLAPILNDDRHFVQGSRFLPGGSHSNMPFYRVFATRYMHPIMFSILSGKWVTETTNGFRAIRTDVLRDERINWKQDWLDMYELEQYVHFKVVRLGYRRVEVPVSKNYPARGQAYTKVKPLTGWWSMIKPILYLAFGIKK